jgi:predicted metal-dependent TIM-barrel fold hydrolase
MIPYIDPHIHMASRTTDDLAQLARTGCVAVAEPAFWCGFDRSSASGFYDYFRQLTEWEPTRAAPFGIRHYAWIGFNSKEAENVARCKEVVAFLPEFLDRPNVLGVGEIGLNKNTKNEVASLLILLDAALSRNELLVFHTPHMADKYAGTRMILDLLRADSRVDRRRVCVDHCEEHTIRLALDEGYWAGITMYPTTKSTPERTADMVERYGAERILVNSSADWGPSWITAVAEFIQVMRRRGHDEAAIRRIVFDNPCEFLGQSPHFQKP